MALEFGLIILEIMQNVLEIDDSLRKGHVNESSSFILALNYSIQTSTSDDALVLLDVYQLTFVTGESDSC